MDFAKEASDFFVKIVSIDVDRTAVDALLLEKRDDARLADFWSTVAPTSGDTTSMAVEKLLNQSNFSQNTHVTMVHSSEMSQTDIRAKFGPFCGSPPSRVQLQATGLLWNKDVAALSVAISDTTMDGQAVPPCSNSFSHVTLWCQKGVKPVAANSLPELVDQGGAHRVDFEPPVKLEGSFSLWPQHKH